MTTKETVAALGCQLISEQIVKRKTRIKYVCKCGREAEAYMCNFKRFPNCKKCGADKMRGDKCYRWKDDRKAVSQRRKMHKKCQQLLFRTLDAFTRKKERRTHELLGYTGEELFRHLNALGAFDMHEMEIDHIFPIKAFFDYGIDDPSIINHLSNLQPLTITENRIKGSNYDPQQFKMWLSQFTLKIC